MNVNHLPPSFVQQADALLLRIAKLDLGPSERKALEAHTREKHRLIQQEAKFLTELTAWADMTEAEVAYRKALEDSKAKTERYYRTMDDLREVSPVQVTEYVAADHPAEEAA